MITAIEKKAITLLFLGGLGWAASCCAAPTAALPTSEQVDAVLGILGDDGPGCAVAVVLDGRVVHRGGYGMAELEHEVPIVVDTRFDLGSVSKQFTAATIFHLASTQGLSLETPVVALVPEMIHLRPEVEVRHLVHHTSGLRDYFVLWSLAGRDIDDSMPRSAVLALIARQRGTLFEAGSAWSYSNSNYFLLAEIVERVTGRSLREVAEEALFGRLEMASTEFYDDRTRLLAHRAAAYGEREDGSIGRTVLRSTIVGDGGVYSTVGDLSKWHVALEDPGSTALAPGLVRDLLEPGALDDGTPIPYAGGLRLRQYRGVGTVEHGGTMGGYRSYFLRMPAHRFAAIVLCNLLELSPNQLSRRLADLYLGDRLEPLVGSPPPPFLRSAVDHSAPREVPMALRGDSEGRFGSAELPGAISFHEVGGVLQMQLGEAPPVSLDFLAPDSFATPNGNRVRFERGEGGRIEAFTFRSSRTGDMRFQRLSGER